MTKHQQQCLTFYCLFLLETLVNNHDGEVRGNRTEKMMSELMFPCS